MAATNDRYNTRVMESLLHSLKTKPVQIARQATTRFQSRSQSISPPSISSSKGSSEGEEWVYLRKNKNGQILSEIERPFEEASDVPAGCGPHGCPVGSLPKELLSDIIEMCYPFDFVAQWVNKRWRKTWQRLVYPRRMTAVRAGVPTWKSLDHMSPNMVMYKMDKSIVAWAVREQGKAVSEVTFFRAVYHNDEELVLWLAANGCPIDGGAWFVAAERGHLNMIILAELHGWPVNTGYLVYASRHNQTEVLEWALSRREVLVQTARPLSSLGIHMMLTDPTASSEEHKPEIIRRSNLSFYTGLWYTPRDELKTLGEAMCAAAARGGHLQLLMWIVQHCRVDPRLCCIGEAAAAGGDLNTLCWLRDHACNFDEDAFAAAAGLGNMQVLNWFLENGYPCNERACVKAAASGDLDTLRWLRSQGCPWDQNTTRIAAHYDRLDILHWARDNGCPWTEHTCMAAASMGHLGVLKYAVDHGCPCTNATALCAAKHGQIGILDWLHQRQAVDRYACIRVAKVNNQWDLVSWAKANLRQPHQDRSSSGSDSGCVIC